MVYTFVHGYWVAHCWENMMYDSMIWVCHCGLVGSARTWDRTGCESDSWQCWIYIISHVHRAYVYLGPFRVLWIHLAWHKNCVKKTIWVGLTRGTTRVGKTRGSTIQESMTRESMTRGNMTQRGTNQGGTRRRRYVISRRYYPRKYDSKRAGLLLTSGPRAVMHD